jgi:hypothetical protein
VLPVYRDQELFVGAAVVVVSMPGADPISVRREAGAQQGAPCVKGGGWEEHEFTVGIRTVTVKRRS